ncbi:MAG: hypothetical protein WBE18_02115 [Gammaproteobacteria bacterium]
MPKNRTLQKPASEVDDFSFMVDDDPNEDHEVVNDMLENVFQVANHQIHAALELTKIITDKTTQAAVSKEQIFDTYREALKVIAESSPLLGLMEKLG